MRSILIAILLLLLFSGCYNDKYDKLYPVANTGPTTCDTTAVSYARDIVPILTAKCNISGGCHDAAGAATTSGYNFTTITQLQALAQTPLLLGDLNWQPGHNQMPKNGSKLSACEIAEFTAWADQGALNN